MLLSSAPTLGWSAWEALLAANWLPHDETTARSGTGALGDHKRHVMDRLLQTVSSLDFEEYGGLRLLEASWPGRACRLRFRVWPGEPVVEGDSRQEPYFGDWLVDCLDVRAVRVLLERADHLALATEHPLLWSYFDGETELAFSGKPADAGAVVAAIWAEHRALVGDWIPFGQHLNVFDPSAPVVGLLRTGGGVFAAGPRPLMQAYAKVLQSHGLENELHRRPSPRAH